MWISRVGDGWISARLFDLTELDARLAEGLALASATAAEHANAFDAARSGHFDALLHLARALGGGAGLTFNIIADTNGRVGRMPIDAAAPSSHRHRRVAAAIIPTRGL